MAQITRLSSKANLTTFKSLSASNTTFYNQFLIYKTVYETEIN